MTQKQLAHYEHEINQAVAQRSIAEAIKGLRRMSGDNPSWEVTRDIDRLADSYSLMSRYAIDGMADPQRDNIYTDMVESISDIVTRLKRNALMADSPSLYFSIVRVNNMRQSDPIDSLLAKARHTLNSLSMALLTGERNPIDPDTRKPLRQTLEDVWLKLFNRVWTTFPLNIDHETQLQSMFDSPVFPDYFKDSILSALLLGEIEYHDERRLWLMMQLIDSPVQQRSIKALTALMASLWIHRDRHLRRRLRNRLDALKERPTWDADVKCVAMHLIRSRDTERINRKIQEEIIPDILKLGREFRENVEKQGGKIDIIELDENPEWEDMLNKSGLADKLKQFTELQEDGSDVLLSSFGNLKQFPFFNEAANWFLPFHIEHSSIANGIASNAATFASVLEQSPILCDSDKFSLACSFNVLPIEHLQGFLNQFESHSSQMMKIQSSATDSNTAIRDNTANRYVQNLYRFFKLFRRKDEFHDIFAEPFNPLTLGYFSESLTDPSMLRVVSEFYFARHYYDDALALFDRITAVEGASAELCQKTGYCHQQMGRTTQALEAYQQAEMLNPNSLWTMRRIAACLRQLSSPDKAFDYYRRILAKNPDDITTTLNAGHSLLEQGRYADALKHYFKVEFLDPKHRALRPLAWTLLMDGQTDRARDYYLKVTADTPTATDWLNFGHLEMAAGNYRQAADYYYRAVALMRFDISAFDRALAKDSDALAQLGVSQFIQGIVADEVRNQANKQPRNHT